MRGLAHRGDGGMFPPAPRRPFQDPPGRRRLAHGRLIDRAMKRTSISKNSSLPVDTKPHVPPSQPAGSAPGASLTGSSSAKRSERSHPSSVRTSTSARGVARTAQSGGFAQGSSTTARARPSGKRSPTDVQPTPNSMDAIRQDRVTLIAFYALFGAVLAGVIYFIVLVFLI